jgi:hypothetical protein
MKPVVLQQDNPELWPERLCTQLPVDAFFPDDRDVRGIAQAQAVCRTCPMLARCAEWAAQTRLTHCVVASVKMPAYGVGASAELAELRRIAADETGAESSGEVAA